MNRTLGAVLLLSFLVGCQRVEEPKVQRAPAPIQPVATQAAPELLPLPPPPPQETAKVPPTESERPALLTPTRIEALVASMKDVHNPLSALFGEDGAARSVADMQEKRVENDAFAREHGFKDYDDFMHAWGRVEAIRRGKKTQGEVIRKLEEVLARTDLTPDQRRRTEEQVEQLRVGPYGGFSVEEIALVERFDTQYQEATTKLQK